MYSAVSIPPPFPKSSSKTKSDTVLQAAGGKQRLYPIDFTWGITDVRQKECFTADEDVSQHCNRLVADGEDCLTSFNQQKS